MGLDFDPTFGSFNKEGAASTAETTVDHARYLWIAILKLVPDGLDSQDPEAPRRGMEFKVSGLKAALYGCPYVLWGLGAKVQAPLSHAFNGQAPVNGVLHSQQPQRIH